jgi:hypothetical protein
MKIVSMKDVEDLANQVNVAFKERDRRITELEERVESLIQTKNETKSPVKK